jgi:hypothetical protein
MIPFTKKESPSTHNVNYGELQNVMQNPKQNQAKKKTKVGEKRNQIKLD